MYREDRQEQSEEELLFSRLSEFDEDSDEGAGIIEILGEYFQQKWGIFWRVMEDGKIIIDAS